MCQYLIAEFFYTVCLFLINLMGYINQSMNAQIFYTTRAICQNHDLDIDTLSAMVDMEIAHPKGPVANQWRFSWRDSKRLAIAAHYYHSLDLDIMAAATALALFEDLNRVRALDQESSKSR